MAFQIADLVEQLSFQAKSVLLAGRFPIGPSPTRGELERWGLVDPFGRLQPIGADVAQAITRPPKTTKARAHKYAAQACFVTPDLQLVKALSLAEGTAPDPAWQAFPSLKEGRHFVQLSLLARTGEIRHLHAQVPFNLFVTSPDGTRVRISRYVADYVYERRVDDTWRLVVVDAKGVRTRMYRLKKKWLKAQEGIELVEV